MTEFNKMRITDFYYNYLLLLCFFSSIFYWFQADLASWLRLLLLLFVPLPIVWRNKRKSEERLPTSRFAALVLVGISVIPQTLRGGIVANVILCCFLFMIALLLFFVNKYLRGRYTILHCNPSVSEETKKRAGRMQRKPLLVLSAIAAAILFLLVTLTVLMPDIEMSERTNHQQQERDNTLEKAQNKKVGEVQKKLQEEQEKASDNFWLQLLRYVVTFAIFVMVTLAILYAIFRFILYLMRRRRKVTYEYKELVDERTDFEEITRLVPIVKKSAEFPKGWAGQIRKAFYQSVQRGAGKQAINCALTPQELHKEYMGEGEQNELLTTLYEKARYAEYSVNEQDWRKWEEVSRKR